MKAKPATPGQRARLEAALNADVSIESLVKFAQALKAEGLVQAPMYQLFDECRRMLEEEGDEALCATLDDVLDVIAGWCEPERWLFPTELEL